MIWLSSFLLGLIQGITEFLPISSTAHLQIAQIMGLSMSDPILLDAWVHFGTVAAIALYYRKTLISLTLGWLKKPLSFQNESKEVYALLLATLPAVVFGFLFKDFIEEKLASPWVVGFDSIFFGLILGLAFYYNQKRSQFKEKEDWTWFLALVVGLSQAISLFPAVSRSGICITAALFLGFKAIEAARFAFLMSIPVTLGAIVLILLTHQIDIKFQDLAPYLFASIISFVAAWITVSLFLRFLLSFGMLPFVIYRVSLGVLVLFLAFFDIL